MSLFEGARLRLDDAIELSLASLREYGQRYRHWSVAYSGGKDSSATVVLVAWAIKTGQIPQPDSLTVLYDDTRQEFPPLQTTAMELLARLRSDGFEARNVLPLLDDRFYVYILGYGVPPPSNTFRWCTEKIKIKPMTAALQQKRDTVGEKFLLINGVRLGESAARDQRIAISCNKDSGECGQGWFEVKPPDCVGDSLAPLLHWRVCHVFDWCYFETHKHGYPEIAGIADVYGDEDVRTGCIGCPLASRDRALENLIRKTEWEHLRPLLELRSLFKDLKKPKWRKRKLKPELRKDGEWGKNVQRMGPLTMEGRAYGLERVLDIQQRAGVDLINQIEEMRIRRMWDLDMWPRKWSADDASAIVPFDALTLTDDGKLVRQALLM